MKLLGGCLQAVGILIAGLFGLCTVIMFGDVHSWRSFGAAGQALTYTIIPFLFGVALIFVGRTLVRNARDGDY